VNVGVLATVYGITLMGGLWPFGSDNRPEDTQATIGSLAAHEIDLQTTPVVPGGAAAARDQYREFLAISKDNPALQREAMRRLGDLNLAAGEDEEIELGPEAAAGYYAEAVQLYTALLAANPDHPDTDKILYQLARAYETIGAADKALDILDRLVAGYADSRFFDEAQFRRGEILFVRKDFPASAVAYAAVVASGASSTYYQQSLYKHGWAMFKRSRYEASLNSFMTLLDVRLGDAADAGAALQAMSRAERELLDDAFRVLAISLAYLDGHTSLNGLLDQWGLDRRGAELRGPDERAPAGRGDPAYVGLLYAALGDLYLDQERYQDAANTYAAFVARMPTDARAPAMQVRVIEALTLAKFPSLVLEAKRDYIDLYGLHSAFWAGRMVADWSGVVDQLKMHLTDLASYDHAQAQADDNAAAYARAADWYHRFIAYFPDDPDSAARNYLLADIWFELERYGQANTEYLRTAYDYGPHEQAAAAGFAALLSAEHHAEMLEGAALVVWHTQSLDNALRFARTFPGHEQAASVLTHAAEEFFRSGATERAIEVAGRVVTLQPPASMQLERTAWTVIAHANFDLARFAPAERAYERLLLMPLAAGIERSDYAERVAATVYRQAEQAQAAGDVDLAVAQFLRVAMVQPTSPFVANALYDAGTLLLANQRWGEAVDVLERFRAAFPAHRFNDDVTQKLAVAYQSSGQHGRAAAEYERVASFADADPELHREALWQAADLYELQGSRADQRRVYAQIVARFPTPFGESLEAQYKLANLARESNDWADRQQWLAAIVAADAGAGAARSARSRTLAAQARLELAAPARDAFRTVKLTIPLKSSLKLKKARMEAALAAYGQAADYGIAAVTTAASFEIADLYYVLSQDLMNSERPKELSADELEQYDILLEEQAFPFEEQAIDIFKSNASRASDGVYDEWVKKSFARLAELLPFRYAKSERSERFVAALD